MMLIFATIIPLWIYSSTPPPPPVTKFSEKCLFPNRPSNLDQIRYVMAGVGTLSFSNAMTFTIYGFYKKIPWMPLIAIALWAAHSYLFLQITGYYTGGNGIFPGQPCLPRT
ncbi:hypothetical protein KEM60_02933 [Austwickia sp. TVS 96-490-7B]|nr:hypothetical protein [Austwickia sp. TVS 96-490-7B]